MSISSWISETLGKATQGLASLGHVRLPNIRVMLRVAAMGQKYMYVRETGEVKTYMTLFVRAPLRRKRTGKIYSFPTAIALEEA